MSIYSVFIYENHHLQEHRPDWMSAERYEYCDQASSIVAPGYHFPFICKKIIPE